MWRPRKVVGAILLGLFAVFAFFLLFADYIVPIAHGWPLTVRSASDIAVTWLSPADRKTLAQTSKEDLVRYHLGLGMAIRNEFGLWGGNGALLNSACGGTPCHPDDASMVIVEQVWLKVREQERQ